jgi:hypothetical protein
VDQFGAKDLKPFAEFLDLVVYFFFNIRSLLDLVADMNVHESLRNAGGGSREACGPSS